ncbi:cilia- and flagella-associated protein 77 [Astyanax mexicanus]|uniref:cilia- and flagella-associated protein 77 n=1 Tax=Astyanax mexicanus TaxID=7994 RepID=UPI0020CAED9D|nr:cilia- and flagella-associated protein 77 [Astyanax mexicanus]
MKKSAIGKSQSRRLSCPGPDFVYGAPTIVRDGGVAEAISNWDTASLNTSSSARKAERDFVALNREGVKSGMVTARDLRHYRATHDIQRPIVTDRHPPTRIPQDIPFGVPTRPSESIADMLQYRFAQKWLEEQQAKEKTLLGRKPKKVQLGRIRDTRTTLLQKARPLEQPPSTWQLPRFQQIGPALDTFRDPEARERAMAVHNSASRRGT